MSTENVALMGGGKVVGLGTELEPEAALRAVGAAE